MNSTSNTIAIIGLGYVGLPLAVAFGRHRPVIGFDIDAARIEELQGGHDRTREVSNAELSAATGLDCSSDLADLRAATVFIVTVPTPIDDARRPDLRPLESASRTVGSVLKRGDLVIYESTVYPGATEEVCVPILEAESGLRFNQDFVVGYSPERINPGDKAHRIETILKVTSGSTPEAAQRVDALYRQVITAGTHLASSIRVAEAAKVIENTQRDVNIGLVNELALLFNRLGIDTEEVLQAAGTKWNFLPFRPGLVGGHCIGVDPYYLTHKAQQVGFHPAMILAGRRTNDAMATHVAAQLVKAMLNANQSVVGSRVLIMGLAFKENCPDVRNTKVVDIVQELGDFGALVEVHDPWVDPREARAEHGIELVDAPQAGRYHAIVLAVAHQSFVALGADGARRFGAPGHVLYDLKYCFEREEVDLRL